MSSTCLEREYIYATSEDVRLSLESDGNFSLIVFGEYVTGAFDYYPNEKLIDFNVQSEPLSGAAVTKYLNIAKMDYDMSSFIDAFAENTQISFPVRMGLQKKVFIIMESNDYYFSSTKPCE